MKKRDNEYYVEISDDMLSKKIEKQLKQKKGRNVSGVNVKGNNIVYDCEINLSDIEGQLKQNNIYLNSKGIYIEKTESIMNDICD